MNDSGCTRPVSVPSPRTESLPFSAIPSQTRLFIDYQTDPLSLKRFYPSAVASYTDLTSRVDEVLNAYTCDRGLLCNALERTNLDLKAGTETLANVAVLRDPGAVAVLTGQQVGLFTGPLYSVYKALSAIRMAEWLCGKGVKAVPVFWMATEDHDLDEVSNAFAIDNGGQLFESKALFGSEVAGLSVGNVRLGDANEALVGELFASLPATEFSAAVRKQLEHAYEPGASMGRAFGRFLLSLLGKFGLVVVDPLDAGIKELAAPVYVKAIERSGAITDALTVRNGQLADAGYHSQVLVEEDYFPLFWHADDGRRLALRRRGDGSVHAKDERRNFTVSELAELAADHPERFSPGVMLRPVVQDHLFPTLCYFGGGAEIAYFAQNSEVYRTLERPVTPILHRQSFTVVEAKHARTLEKYGLTLADLFEGEDAVLPRVIDEFIDPGTARLFADVEENMNTELHRLDEALSAMDVTLAANLATRRRKILYHIGAMRRKYHARRAVSDETINRRLRTAFAALLPHGQLQERTLNVVGMLDRFGPGFIDWIYSAADLDDKGHRIVFL